MYKNLILLEFYMSIYIYMHVFVFVVICKDICLNVHELYAICIVFLDS